MNLLEFQQSEDSAKPHFLLLGNPVAHSLSPLMHNTASEYYDMGITYHAIKLEQSELSSLSAHLNKESFKGANITIPYKQQLMEYMDAVDTTASAIGAVNTIVKDDYYIRGCNTDSYGFYVPLKAYEDELEGGKAIVFGTGGASRAIIFALLNQLSFQKIVVISRNPANRNDFEIHDQISVEGYDTWTTHAEEASLIINATPLGMEPQTESAPIRDKESEALSGKICYDIVYKPLKTRFLTLAENAGARTIGGLEMLIHQGSRSFELWTGKPFPIKEVRNKLYEVIKY